MINPELIAAATGLISILLLLVLMHFYKVMQVDKYRQKLFALRDNLFLEAAKGVIPFEDEAYSLLRLLINAHIRYAHKNTLVKNFFLMSVLEEDAKTLKKEGVSDRFEAALERVSERQKMTLLRYYVQMHMLVIGHMVNKSIFLTSIALVAKMISGFLRPKFAMRRKVRRRLEPQFRALDQTAMSIEDGSNCFEYARV